mgnify:CR=1 FL=1
MIKNIKFIEQKEKILLQRGKLIHEDQQGKHIIGHKNYKEEEGKSITTLSMAKMEELLQKYAGTGQIARDNGERVDFKEIIEPLRDLFKDEVRKVGLELGIPEYLVFRQPFPGPGLGIRIIGEVTEEKVKIVQDADFIYREEIAKVGLDRSIGQYFAALTNMHSVGVMGDERTYDYAVVLRAVNTIDFMTAESAEIPYQVLNKVMSRIINEVRGVNRVFYDITSKPPGTIEFE